MAWILCKPIFLQYRSWMPTPEAYLGSAVPLQWGAPARYLLFLIQLVSPWLTHCLP